MKNILFYITGHGFGHATRAIEVINELNKLARGIFLYVNTFVPEWLFKQRISSGNFGYVHCENDIGTIQKDWFRVDKAATLRAYADFVKEEKGVVAQELEFVRDSYAPGDVVVVMSNGGFGGIHEHLLSALEQRFAAARRETL